MLTRFAVVALLLAWSSVSQSQQVASPWSPEHKCALQRSRTAGLNPTMLASLDQLELRQRITQTINLSSNRGNVHGPDGKFLGVAYTAAVDLSVRCLSDENIRVLLGRLADAGFVAWFRNPGTDSWKGPRHIHAVWVESDLKPALNRQFNSWLNRRNGLVDNRPYRFWTQSDLQIDQIKRRRQTYLASNSSSP